MKKWSAAEKTPTCGVRLHAGLSIQRQARGYTMRRRGLDQPQAPRETRSWLLLVFLSSIEFHPDCYAHAQNRRRLEARHDTMRRHAHDPPSAPTRVRHRSTARDHAGRIPVL